MLRAIIFDFNGIILNDEPLHFAAMRDAIEPHGIPITKEEYWSKYLPFDDATCLRTICADRRVEFSEDQFRQTLERKISLYQQLIQNEYPLFPGVRDFIRASSAHYPLALASGARREEIEGTLEATGLIRHFQVIVGAEDFKKGKPHPESFLLALERLNSKLNSHRPHILPGECLVIEDSVGGVHGARAAGMVCLAVSNTYPSARLQAAHRVVSSLEEVRPERLESFLQEAS